MATIIKLSAEDAHELAMKLGRIDVRRRDWDDANLSYRLYCNRLLVENGVPLDREIVRIDFDREVMEVSDVSVPPQVARRSPEGVEVVGSVFRPKEVGVSSKGRPASGRGEVGEFSKVTEQEETEEKDKAQSKPLKSKKGKKKKKKKKKK